MKKSPFQRQVAKDFLNTFLSEDGFGRKCEWNGGKLLIVEAAADSVMTGDGIGLLHDGKKIICRSRDLSSMPRPGDVVTLDHTRWRVVDSHELFGHYEILLERHTGA